MKEFLLISGLSGAGKSRTAEFLEDMGYYIVDNLPFPLMSALADTCLNGGEQYERTALVCDIRGGTVFDECFSMLERLCSAGCEARTLFLDCSAETIIRRYKETRRIHPLCADGTLSLEAAIRQEREWLKVLKKRADLTLDTSGFATSGQLRSALLELLGTPSSDGMELNVMSFGYKYGIPMEADLLIDVRFLPNPYYIPELRPMTGLDKPIVDYLSQSPEFSDFLQLYQKNLNFLLPLYEKEGKRVLTIGVGCTGGQHRSVALCHAIAAQAQAMGYTVRERHRDMLRNKK